MTRTHFAIGTLLLLSGTPAQCQYRRAHGRRRRHHELTSSITGREKDDLNVVDLNDKQE